MLALAYSGGKDSCLALYELERQGKEVACLLTTVWKEKGHTVAHEESLDVLTSQAERLGLPIHFIYTSVSTYREDFLHKLKKVKEEYDLKGMAFGDWFIEGHREWNSALAKEVGLEAYFPLWNPEANLLEELEAFLSLGFQAKIVKVDEEKISPEWIGRKLDTAFIEVLRQNPSLCPMGEHGEYHTTVLDGPIFKD